MTLMRASLGASLAFALLLTGCSASGEDQEAAEHASSPAETAEQTPSPEPEEQPWAVFNLKDAAGYELGVEITTVAASGISTIASAPPGFADVTLAMTAEASVQNLTPGRDVPSVPGVDIIAAFDAGSAMCTTEWTYWGLDGQEAARERLLRSSPAGCYIPLGGLMAQELPAPDSDPIAFETQELPSTYAAPFLRVPEASVDAMLAEIDSASLFAAFGAGSSTFGWQLTSPICQTAYDGWLGQPFSVAAAPSGVGCG